MDDPNAGREEALKERQPGHPNLVRGGGNRIKVQYPKIRIKPSEIRNVAAQHLIHSEFIKRLAAVAAGAGVIVAYAGKGKTVYRPPTWKEMQEAGQALIKLSTGGRLNVVMENGEFAVGLMVLALRYIPDDMHKVFEAELQAYCRTFVMEQSPEDAEKAQALFAENEFDYTSMYLGTDTINDSGTGDGEGNE